MNTMRLDKYLASYGGMSRKEARAAVRKGRVLLDGVPAGKEDVRVEDGQEICLDGCIIRAEQYVYYMMNKPAGVVSATKDERERTVLDLVETTGRELFPMGRLDKDTEGLLFLTDDGMLAHRLLSPKFHVEKTYEFTYDGVLEKDAVQRFAEGIDIGEKRMTRPARLELIGEGLARLTISEGKFHQVKRMIAKAGGHVTYLKRISMAGIELDKELGQGEYRRLTEEEIQKLRGET